MPTLKKHVTSNYSRQKNLFRMQTLKEIVKRSKKTKVLDTTFGCFFYRFIVISKRGESCNSSNEFVKTEKMPFIGRSKPKVKARKTFFLLIASVIVIFSLLKQERRQKCKILNKSSSSRKK